MSDSRIDLSNYETVEERIMRFKQAFPNYRIQTDLIDASGEIGKTRWIMKASIWKQHDDEIPASTGWAFEIDGAGMTQRTAALETCETSAIGRALANLGFIGNKRVTRQEMLKAKLQEVRDSIAKAATHDELRSIWIDATENKILDHVRGELTAKSQQLQNLQQGGAKVEGAQ